MCERNRALRRGDFVVLANALKGLGEGMGYGTPEANAAFDRVVDAVAITCGHSNTKFDMNEFVERVNGTYVPRSQRS